MSIFNVVDLYPGGGLFDDAMLPVMDESMGIGLPSFNPLWRTSLPVVRVVDDRIIYLLRDDLITPASAPLTSPRTCEPGPGTLTILDTGNAWSINSSGEIVPSAASVATNNPGAWNAAGFARVGGRAFKARIKNVSAFGADANKTFSPMVTWCDVAGSATVTDFEGIAYWVANTKFQVIDSIGATSWTTIETCLADTYNVFVPILRAGGGMFAVVDGKLIGITRQNTDSNVHPDIASLGVNRNPPQISRPVRITDLPAPWNTDFGICTTQLPGARSVSDTFTHEGACHIEFTITTLPASGNALILFRKQDANNHWRIALDNTGLVTIQEVVSGSATGRASIASCAANDRIVVTMNGATITMYRDRPTSGVANTTVYTSALYPNNTAGEVNSLGTGGAIKDLYTYPYNLSGRALDLINAI